MIAFFPSITTAPTDWLKANGAAVAISSYSDLAAAIYVGDSLNATALSGYKCTDSSNPTGTRSTSGTYIVLPDLRGEFLRGYDDSRGIDSGRVINSFQDHQLQDHAHQLTNFFDSGPYGNFPILMFSTGTNYYTLTTSNPTSGNHGAETRPRNISLLACIKY